MSARSNSSVIKLFYILALCCFSGLAAAEPLRIAVASNFYSTLNLIKKEYEKNVPDSISLISGSTGKLYAQILHSAPYDIFMAGDSARPEKLERAGLIYPDSRTTYATGKIALWSPKQTGNHLLSLLQSGNFQKLAIANPKIAPYGQAARQVLEKLELYSSIKSKLVYGENISQTYQFVQSGGAELGFVALSQLMQTHQHYWIIPDHYYKPLEQQLVILKSSNQRQRAQDFIEFLRQDTIRQLISSRGYAVP